MLTLIDTFCVGRADGTLALAALAVNCGASATQRALFPREVLLCPAAHAAVRVPQACSTS
jgi:hypothetical protein